MEKPVITKEDYFLACGLGADRYLVTLLLCLDGLHADYTYLRGERDGGRTNLDARRRKLKRVREISDG